MAPRSARSRAFEIPADVEREAARRKTNTPRTSTVPGVSLDLQGHEPADLLAALFAGKESALAEASAWEARGESERAQSLRDRAARLDQLVVKCAVQFTELWSAR